MSVNEVSLKKNISKSILSLATLNDFSIDNNEKVEIYTKLAFCAYQIVYGTCLNSKCFGT